MSNILRKWPAGEKQGDPHQNRISHHRQRNPIQLRNATDIHPEQADRKEENPRHLENAREMKYEIIDPMVLFREKDSKSCSKSVVLRYFSGSPDSG